MNQINIGNFRKEQTGQIGNYTMKKYRIILLMELGIS
jgi:hypothetical protein